MESQSLLQDMVDNILMQQTLSAVSRFRSIQDNIEDHLKMVLSFERTPPTKDIYGKDKDNLKASEGSRYFQCENCGRNIAASRFAHHIAKCLERLRR